MILLFKYDFCHILCFFHVYYFPEILTISAISSFCEKKYLQIYL